MTGQVLLGDMCTHTLTHSNTRHLIFCTYVTTGAHEYVQFNFLTSLQLSRWKCLACINTSISVCVQHTCLPSSVMLSTNWHLIQLLPCLNAWRSQSHLQPQAAHHPQPGDHPVTVSTVNMTPLNITWQPSRDNINSQYDTTRCPQPTNTNTMGIVKTVNFH